MKQYITFIFLISSLATFGQLKFLPKDTINNFSLTYVQSGGGRDSYYSITINNKGKITVINKDASDEICGKKDIQLDSNTFRQFKDSLITDRKLYSIKDTLEHERVYESTSDVLTVKSNLGTKIIYGSRIF